MFLNTDSKDVAALLHGELGMLVPALGCIWSQSCIDLQLVGCDSKHPVSFHQKRTFISRSQEWFSQSCSFPGLSDWQFFCLVVEVSIKLEGSDSLCCAITFCNWLQVQQKKSLFVTYISACNCKSWQLVYSNHYGQISLHDKDNFCACICKLPCHLSLLSHTIAWMSNISALHLFN